MREGHLNTIVRAGCTKVYPPTTTFLIFTKRPKVLKIESEYETYCSAKFIP